MRNKSTIRRVNITFNEPSPHLGSYGFEIFLNSDESYTFTNLNVAVL